MLRSFRSVIKIYALSRCATDTNFSFDFFPDDISYLNHQEKLFVDDPANAHLFDECSPLKPQSKRKGSIEDTPGWNLRANSKMMEMIYWNRVKI